MPASERSSDAGLLPLTIGQAAARAGVTADAEIAQLSALRAELDRMIDACDSVVPAARCRILGALGGER